MEGNSNTDLVQALHSISSAIQEGSLTGLWQDWVPTISNMTGGTLNYARYMRIGDTVHFRFKYTLAGAGISGEPAISFPVTPHADYSVNLIEPLDGLSVYRDVSAFLTISGVLTYSTNGIVPRASASTTSYAQNTGIASTIPFTWAADDILFMTGSYEAATS